MICNVSIYATYKKTDIENITNGKELCLWQNITLEYSIRRYLVENLKYDQSIVHKAIYLFERITERARYRRTQIFHPLAHSLNDNSQFGQGGSQEPGALRWSSVRGNHLLLPRSLAAT